MSVIFGSYGKADLSDYPLLLHVDEILIGHAPVDIPWDKFTFTND